MKVVGWIIALLGLWEAGDIAALFVPGFGKLPLFLWNHILVGVLLMIAGAWMALARGTPAAISGVVCAAAGGWLVIASFILRNPANFAGLWNDIIVGGVVFILGVWAALQARRAAG